eukprot:GHVH01000665.1.p1 GENE.GHVH01000665.1~~GHVH01000665.1.p1  ORF type:complete len:302 (-),score=35.87 GHVH01000665.1:189-1094(-)
MDQNSGGFPQGSFPKIYPSPSAARQMASPGESSWMGNASMTNLPYPTILKGAAPMSHRPPMMPSTDRVGTISSAAVRTISGCATVGPTPRPAGNPTGVMANSQIGVDGTSVLATIAVDAQPVVLPPVPTISQGMMRRRPGIQMYKDMRLKKKKKLVDPNTPKHLRRCAGNVWNDTTLDEWPADGYRFFIGDLGNEVTDEILTSAFKKYTTFQKAKVITDKKTHKSCGYGFVQVASAEEALRVLNEMDRKYVGNRPITIKRSRWKDRDIDSSKNKMLSHLRAEMSEASRAVRKFKKPSKAHR